MQKNDKSYAFLLSHKSKSRIYIKRFVVSKRLVHFGSLAIFLLIGITTLGFGISRIVTNPAFAEAVLPRTPDDDPMRLRDGDVEREADL